MANYDEDKVFDSLAITDTATHTSSEANSGEFTAKTIFIQNSLDQTVTFQLQGARNAIWIDCGASFTIDALTNGYQTMSDFFPKYRLQASCSTAPTSGNLSVWIIKAR